MYYYDYSSDNTSALPPASLVPYYVSTEHRALDLVSITCHVFIRMIF